MTVEECEKLKVAFNDAFKLAQLYWMYADSDSASQWMYADSDSASQWKKADIIEAKFEALLKKTFEADES